MSILFNNLNNSDLYSGNTWDLMDSSIWPNHTFQLLQKISSYYQEAIPKNTLYLKPSS